MNVVSVKFQENILNKIDVSIEKNNFNSRTEFIREAVRDKLASLNKEELIKEFLKYKGQAKLNTSSKENEQTRIEVGEELKAELDKQFNI